MVQKLQDIKPADAHAGNAKPKDPVQAEYEDGKRYLEKNDLGRLLRRCIMPCWATRSAMN